MLGRISRITGQSRHTRHPVVLSVKGFKHVVVHGPIIGHAIEKSMPVLVKHPIQANLAAPFFTVVEMFKLLGLRDELFNEVQRQIALRRQSTAGSG